MPEGGLLGGFLVESYSARVGEQFRSPEGLFTGKSNVLEGIFEKLKAFLPELLADAG